MEELRRAVDSFAAFIRGLSAGRLRPSDSAEWEPLEVLCHLAFWHEQYLAIVVAVQEDRDPSLLEGTFKSLNAAAVAANLQVPPAELLRRLEQAEAALERAWPGAEELAFSFRKGSKVWPLPKAMELIAGHIQLHEKRLRRAIRTPNSGV